MEAMAATVADSTRSVIRTVEVNGDRPLPVQGILRLLEAAGFQAAALDVRCDRGMLVGRCPA